MTRYVDIKRVEVDEEVKRRIVEEIESGRIGQCAAAREYGISRTAIQKWLKDYGKLRHRTQIVRIVMQDEKERIRELEQALSDAHLKIRLYDSIFDAAGKAYKTDIKKNFVSKASERLKGGGKKLKDSAK